MWCDCIQASFRNVQTRPPLLSLTWHSALESFLMVQVQTSQLCKEWVTAFLCFLTLCICPCSSTINMQPVLLLYLIHICKDFPEPPPFSVLQRIAGCIFPRKKIIAMEEILLKISPDRWVITSTAKGKIQLENWMECKRIFPPVCGNHPSHLLWRLLSVLFWFNHILHTLFLLLHKCLAKPRLLLVYKTCQLIGSQLVLP